MGTNITTISGPQPGVAGNGDQDPQPGVTRDHPPPQLAEPSQEWQGAAPMALHQGPQPGVSGNHTHGPHPGAARDHPLSTKTGPKPGLAGNRTQGPQPGVARDQPPRPTQREGGPGRREPTGDAGEGPSLRG